MAKKIPNCYLLLLLLSALVGRDAQLQQKALALVVVVHLQLDLPGCGAAGVCAGGGVALLPELEEVLVRVLDDPLHRLPLEVAELGDCAAVVVVDRRGIPCNQTSALVLC